MEPQAKTKTHHGGPETRRNTEKNQAEATAMPLVVQIRPAIECLLRFVNHNLLADSLEKVAPDTALFEGGWIDSLKILNLIAYLETQMGRKIPDEQIVMDRFRTITVIARSFLEA